MVMFRLREMPSSSILGSSSPDTMINGSCYGDYGYDGLSVAMTVATEVIESVDLVAIVHYVVAVTVPVVSIEKLT